MVPLDRHHQSAMRGSRTLIWRCLPTSSCGAPIPYEAAFLAAKVFVAYRRRGGCRDRTLPDFFVGAHASVAGLRLLTRDVRRYQTYFPRLELTSP